MGIEKVGVVFNEYCLEHKILKILLPLSVPILIIAAVLRDVQSLVSLGSAVTAVAFVGYIIGILLAFAKAEYQMMALGMGLYSIGYAIYFLRSLIKYQVFGWSSAIYLLVWGFLAYLAYKKSIELNMK